MAYNTVLELRGLVSTESSDAELEQILELSNLTIRNLIDVSLYSESLKSAELYFAGARLLEYLKTTGELAAKIKSGPVETQNSIDAQIKTYDELSSRFASIHTMFIAKTNNTPVPRVGVTSSPLTVGWGGY